MLLWAGRRATSWPAGRLRPLVLKFRVSICAASSRARRAHQGTTLIAGWRRPTPFGSNCACVSLASGGEGPARLTFVGASARLKMGRPDSSNNNDINNNSNNDRAWCGFEWASRAASPNWPASPRGRDRNRLAWAAWTRAGMSKHAGGRSAPPARRATRSLMDSDWPFARAGCNAPPPPLKFGTSSRRVVSLGQRRLTTFSVNDHNTPPPPAGRPALSAAYQWAE
jgi:hypothetical protein